MPRTGRPRTSRLEESSAIFSDCSRRSAPAREVLHARIILLTSEGLTNKEVAKRLSTCAHTVSYWRRRFGRLGLEGLSEMPRAGAPRRLARAGGEGHSHHFGRNPAGCHALEHAFFRCAARTLGRQFIASGGLSACSLIARKSSLLSKDPYFIDKVRDVVGLYGTHPRMLWCLVWTKRAKSRPSSAASPILPMRPGRPQRWSHDYYRHGTASLFAALDVATGRIIGATKSRHRSQRFTLLRQIEREVACDFDVHLILDNYATHKTAEVPAG